jgi:hypothetical protein
VSGAEGTGKSFLATKAIVHLKKHNPQDVQYRDSASLAYFFAREDHKQQLKDGNSILKNLALQITAVDSAFRQYSVLQCKNPENLSTPQNTWRNLFVKFFEQTASPVKRAFLIIDGLDKVEKQEPEDFGTLLENPPCNLHVAFFGQQSAIGKIKSGNRLIIGKEKPESDHKLYFQRQADLKLYIQRQAENISILRQWRAQSREKEAQELATTISDKIMKDADGSFLRPSILLREISGKARKPEILKTLEKPPQKLDDPIKRVLKQLASDPDIENADLNEMLSWVLCTQRPLLLSELDVILRLKQEDNEPYELLGDHMQGKLSSVFKLTYLGGNGESGDASGAPVSDSVYGASLDPTSHGPSPDDTLHAYMLTPDRYKVIQVEFAYPSIGRYLARQRQPKARKRGTDNTEKGQKSLNSGKKAEASHDSPEIGVNVSTAHLHIASMCLNILCDKPPNSYNSELETYSAESFMKHLQLASGDIANLDPDDVQRVGNLLSEFFSDQVRIKKLVHAARTEEQQAMFLNTWFRQEHFRNSISSWIAKAAPGNKINDLSGVVGDCCASIWLNKDGSSVEEYKLFPKFPILIFLGCRKLVSLILFK